MKKLKLVLLLLSVSLISFAKVDYNQLTENAEVSLITCGPGTDLYSVFGHSAIRIFDEKKGIDAVFNYGTFSFSEDFYLQFTLGKLNYMLSAYAFPNFLRDYIIENRSVIEQKLNLNQAEKQAYWDFLRTNLKPENKYYWYDFFYNNCSTKIREASSKISGDALIFDSLVSPADVSFREMVDVFLVEMDWSDFGIDLALGLPCDIKPDYKQKMFLPDELMLAYGNATLRDKPLVKETLLLYEEKPIEHRYPFWFRPLFLSLMFLAIAIVITVIEFKRKTTYNAFDRISMAIFGLVGIFLFFLWFGTDHTATYSNLNLIWANPILFILAFYNFQKAKSTLYFGMLIYSILLTLLLFNWFWLPQFLHYAVFPMVLALLLRTSLFIIRTK